MNITVIGIGRLGLCTALCFEKGGHHVYGVDVRQSYVSQLNDKSFRSPEPFVNKMLTESKNFKATTNLEEALNFANIYFIVVDTPNGGGYNFYDHSKLSRLLLTINSHKVSNKHVVVCCTVMPKYINDVGKSLLSDCHNTTVNYNPEFIAQGNIIHGFLNPDIILIGAETDEAAEVIQGVYNPCLDGDVTYCVMNPLEAEITKISVNGFITTKIAYANMIGDLCKAVDVDPQVVLRAVGSDSRIGNKYFRYGPSFGGPCFPRDTHALAQVLEQNDVYNDLIKATHTNNEKHIFAQADHFDWAIEPVIIEGVSYKAEDHVPIIEESNNVKVALELTKRGVDVKLKDTEELINLVKMEHGNRLKYEVVYVETPVTEKTFEKTAVVFGAGGFIGSHLVTRLRKDGYYVIGVDIKHTEFSPTTAHKFYKRDLRNCDVYDEIIPQDCDELYQLAADMGGATFVFTGENDSEIMHNSALINLHTCHWAVKKNIGKVFYSSSACTYNEQNQLDPDNPICTEDSAYPANPDSEYGWEKVFSERLYMAFHRNHGLQVRIARYHNVTGPEGTWHGGREKAPAAICRKVAMAKEGGEIEVFGDGKQTRSFLHVDECVEGTLRLMKSDFMGPVNIGSDESVPINELVEIVMNQAGKKLTMKHIDGPLGVRGRTSDNTLILEKLEWQPQCSLRKTIADLYPWVENEVRKNSQV